MNQEDRIYLDTFISLYIEADRSNIVRLSRFVDIALDFFVWNQSGFWVYVCIGLFRMFDPADLFA